MCFTTINRNLTINFLKQWKLIFNISVNRNGKKLTVSRKMARVLTVSRKKTKILTVNRKRYHPIETLITVFSCSWFIATLMCAFSLSDSCFNIKKYFYSCSLINGEEVKMFSHLRFLTL